MNVYQLRLKSGDKYWVCAPSQKVGHPMLREYCHGTSIGEAAFVREKGPTHYKRLSDDDLLETYLHNAKGQYISFKDYLPKDRKDWETDFLATNTENI